MSINEIVTSLKNNINGQCFTENEEDALILQKYGYSIERYKNEMFNGYLISNTIIEIKNE